MSRQPGELPGAPPRSGRGPGRSARARRWDRGGGALDHSTARPSAREVRLADPAQRLGGLGRARDPGSSRGTTRRSGPKACAARRRSPSRAGSASPPRSRARARPPPRRAALRQEEAERARCGQIPGSGRSLLAAQRSLRTARDPARPCAPRRRRIELRRSLEAPARLHSLAKTFEHRARRSWTSARSARASSSRSLERAMPRHPGPRRPLRCAAPRRCRVSPTRGRSRSRGPRRHARPRPSSWPPRARSAGREGAWRRSPREPERGRAVPARGPAQWRHARPAGPLPPARAPARLRRHPGDGGSRPRRDLRGGRSQRRARRHGARHDGAHGRNPRRPAHGAADGSFRHPAVVRGVHRACLRRAAGLGRAAWRA